MNYTRRAMMKDGLLAVSAGMIMPSVFARAVRAAQNAAREGRHVGAGGAGTHAGRRADGGRQRWAEHHRSVHRSANYKSARPTLALWRGSGARPERAARACIRRSRRCNRCGTRTSWRWSRASATRTPSLSHFTAMDIWQTVDVDGQGRSTKGGWLGNYAKYSAAMIDEDGHPFTIAGGRLDAAHGAARAERRCAEWSARNTTEYRLLPDAGAASAVRRRRRARPDAAQALQHVSEAPRRTPRCSDATAQSAVDRIEDSSTDAVSGYTTTVTVSDERTSPRACRCSPRRSCRSWACASAT